MVVKVSALPDEYFLEALKPLLKQIKLPFFLKRKFKKKALQLHQSNNSHSQRLEALSDLIGDNRFFWKAGKDLLVSEGKKPDTHALLTLFIENCSFNTYLFSQREEILEQLKFDKEGQLQIHVNLSLAYSGTVAPCGRKRGDILENSRSLKKEVPPCDSLRCACEWQLYEES